MTKVLFDIPKDLSNAINEYLKDNGVFKNKQLFLKAAVIDFSLRCGIEVDSIADREVNEVPEVQRESNDSECVEFVQDL